MSRWPMRLTSYLSSFFVSLSAEASFTVSTDGCAVAVGSSFAANADARSPGSMQATANMVKTRSGCGVSRETEEHRMAHLPIGHAFYNGMPRTQRRNPIVQKVAG